MTKQELLNLKVESPDHDDDLTIKGYLKLLLLKVWEEGEEFNGKRPFGMRDWEYDLYKPLVKSKAVDGVLDEEGFVYECDNEAANELVLELIEACFKA